MRCQSHVGRTKPAISIPLPVKPEELGDKPYFTEQERSFWAFQPIRRVAPPAVKHPDRVRNPVDQFLLARLEQEGLEYSDEADRATLIRRVYFDLLGIPRLEVPLCHTR